MENRHQRINKGFDIVIKENNEEKREIVAIGSQEKVDRDRDIVVIDGIDFKNYKNNPLLLWSHRSSDPPIGKATKVWKENGKLMFKLQFATMEEYGFADTIYKLLKGGYLNAFSIGFSPDWKQAVFDEKVGGYVFNKVDLLEISVVNVPANPNALVQSKSIEKALNDNVIDNVELDEFKSYLEKVEEETEEELIENEKKKEEISITDNPVESINKWMTKLQAFESIINELTKKVNKQEQILNEIDVQYKKDNETYLDQLLQELCDSSDTKSENESNDDLKGGENQIESLIDDYLGEN